MYPKDPNEDMTKFEGQLQHDVSLKTLHTFGLDANATHYRAIQSNAQLKNVFPCSDAPFLILGGGSNLVFIDDFEGLLIHMRTRGIEVIKESKHEVWVKVQAGEVWHDLVLWSLDNQYGGLENLSLIPGTVGAAPIQNIGAYGVELESVFDQLEAIECRTGRSLIMDHKECAFGYRDSVFKGALKNQCCITSVILRLTKGDHRLHLDYGRVRAELESQGIESPTPRDVSNAVIKIRRSKLPDPTTLGNAGSFFKNPIIPKALYQLWKAEFPSVPGYEVAPDSMKVPAGWIIDSLDWRGKGVGGAAVYENHALVLINRQDATSTDLKSLIKKINLSVQGRYGIKLEPEVNLIG